MSTLPLLSKVSPPCKCVAVAKGLCTGRSVAYLSAGFAFANSASSFLNSARSRSASRSVSFFMTSRFFGS
jgi:hypothetical protein